MFAGDLQVCNSTANGGCAAKMVYTRDLDWHADIVKNTLDNSATPGDWTEGIMLHVVQQELGGTTYNQGLHGNTFFDVEIRQNAVTAHTPNVPEGVWYNSLDGCYYYVGAWGSNGVDAGTLSAYPGALVSLMGINMNQNTSTAVVDSNGNPVSAPLHTTNGVAGIVTANNF